MIDNENKFERSELLLGSNYIEKIKNKKIAIFGLGGVGGICTEILVRLGFENFDLYDFDIVNKSNFNRQIIATTNNLGKLKTESLKERIKLINENCIISTNNEFLDEENINHINFSKYDYVIDCIDTISTKLAIIEKCYKNNVKIISSMGTGNKINSNCLSITDIFNTSYCPLAKVMRKELKKRNVKKLTVLFSDEEVIKHDKYGETIGSVPFVTNIAGIKIAEYVVKDLLKKPLK